MSYDNFGGYLPLELNRHSEYHKEELDRTILRFNSCKAGICYAIMQANVKRVFIPHYICNSVITSVKRTGIKIERYYIGDDLMPKGHIGIGKDDMILIVNYFGIIHHNIERIIQNFDNIIIDNSHAFFEKPIIRDGIYNVYSCKKFIGTPDGGYLITKKLQDESNLFEMDYSSKHMDFCLLSMEYGTGYAYESKKRNDIRILNNPRAMSYMTYRILLNADYDSIIEQRRSNFKVVDEFMREYNKWEFKDSDVVPYYYPLYFDRSIQTELVRKGVFVPVLWSELQHNAYNGTLEQMLSKNISFLPIDQRYDNDDMQIMCERVRTVCERGN